MLLGLVSAKGAPGVTSAALALTAASGGLMVELDPSGGSVDCWLSGTGEPGLIRAASALRRHADPDVVAVAASDVVPGARVMRAPTSGVLAESTIVALGDRLLPLLGGLDETVVVDGGRWARSQPTARRLIGCDVVALVCAPTVDGIEAARWQAEQLSRLFDHVALVPVGDRPYGPTDIAGATGTEIVGTIAWDRRGLGRLLDRGAGGGWHRTSLARSARQILNSLGWTPQPVAASNVSEDGALADDATDLGVAHA